MAEKRVPMKEVLSVECKCGEVLTLKPTKAQDTYSIYCRSGCGLRGFVYPDTFKKWDSLGLIFLA
jgi:hypothetical protein